MTLSSYLQEIRAVIAGFPPLDAQTTAERIEPSRIYFPKSHSAALDPDRSVVVGNRGMGKSFWANALYQQDSRAAIGNHIRGGGSGFPDLEVRIGFADAEGAIGVSRDEVVKLLNAGISAELIWRSVALKSIAQIAGSSIPEGLAAIANWALQEPQEVRSLFRSADEKLSIEGKKLVVIFDQIEQLSDYLDQRQMLTQGIFRLALAFKSYRSFRVKVFLRLDQFNDDRIFGFPDSSKIKGEAITLDWRPHELYGLLFTRLFHKTPAAFRRVVSIGASRRISFSSDSEIPELLMSDEICQKEIFDKIAGEYMGKTKKRGVPYKWLVLHLSDAKNQVSPRTFLRALKHAADHEPIPASTAIDYQGIQDGVRKASENRVDDLKEDYPWIPPALGALNGLLVPCEPTDLLRRWKKTSVQQDMRNSTPSEKQPKWLDLDTSDGIADALLNALASVGIVEVRQSTGKVDVPDIFRLPAGIRRKGGVTPQQRRRKGA